MKIILAALIALTLNSSVHADQEDDVRAAAAKGFRALMSNEIKDLLASTTPVTKEVEANVRFALEESRQHDRLTRAVFQKFPKEAPDEWLEPNVGEAQKMFLDILGKAPLKIDGKTAVLTLIGALPDVKVTKERGIWKPDLGTWLREREKFDRQDFDWAERSKGLAKMYAEFADRVEKNEFKTIAELRKVLRL